MAWEHGTCLTLEDFTDDTNATIMVVEVRDSQTHWAAPVDLDRATMSVKINDESRPSIGSHHPTVANVLFVDGSAMALPNDLPEDDLAALLTRGGGESIDRDALATFRGDCVSGPIFGS
ncbi:MAG: H-X9-DG-CTERM domain-containing protein [Patescibacteria group bacterium]|nr:H-X9-DG-CTERM domain-containing protein [Patescibacteria group bacterium]